jgi:hypothetical protein
LPVVVRTPETTQELEPRPDPAGPSMLGRPLSTSYRWRNCSCAPSGSRSGGPVPGAFRARFCAGGTLGADRGSAAAGVRLGTGRGSAAAGVRLGTGRGSAAAGVRLGTGRGWAGRGGKATGGSSLPLPGP